MSIQEVLVPTNRFRKVFSADDIAALARSIADVGLINLPVMRGKTLVAGERRLRALQFLCTQDIAISYNGQRIPVGLFPHQQFSELSELTALEIELQENTIRIDLSWQERIAALAKLFEIRKALDSTYSIERLQKEAQQPDNSTIVRDRITLAGNLHIPEVAAAATERDGLKALKRHVENAFAATLGSLPINQSGSHIVKLGDAQQLFIEAPEFDLLLSDPPFGQGAHLINADMKIKHNYDDSWESVRPLLWWLASTSYAKAKTQAHAYVFCAFTHFQDITDAFTDAGWFVWPRPLIWHKDVGHIPSANYGPRYDYECLLFANKGDKPVQFLASDVLTFPAVKKENKLHAAEKPVELLVELIRRSCIPGDVIVDPFCGSGSIFPAATVCQVLAWGCDLDPRAIGLAAERMEGV